jgi:hypothetical protein
MTIERVLGAKSAWTVPSIELNPLGRNLDRWLEPLLAKWYGFGAAGEIAGGGILYAGGEFRPAPGESVIGVELMFFPGGIIAKTLTHTDHSDAFLEAFLERLSEGGGPAYRPSMIRCRDYATEWVVRFDQPLAPLAPLADFYRLLGELLYPGAKPSFDLLRMDFDADPLTPGKRPGSFILQRYGPFEDRRYCSTAPLSTEAHRQALEALEQALCPAARPGPQLIRTPIQ